MNKKKEMKSVAFKRLLPEIYKKIIMEHATHVEVSEWLFTAHDLDLRGSKKDAKPFSNYLSQYGAIKVAKKSYADNIENPENIAQHWYREFTDADPKKTTESSYSTDVDSEPQKTDATSKVDDIAKTKVVPKGKSQRISEKLGVVKRKPYNAEDLLKDFNPKL